MYVNFTAFYQG